MLSSRSKRIWLFSLLTIPAVAAIGYFGYLTWKTSKVVNLPTPDCDLIGGPCTSTLSSGESIELRIKPTYMPVLTSVHLEVKTDKIPVRKMYVYFKGADMNMGEFRFTLLPQRDGIYSAQTILPTCIQEDMLWNAVVQIETNKKMYNAEFKLTNQRPKV